MRVGQRRKLRGPLLLEGESSIRRSYRQTRFACMTSKLLAIKHKLSANSSFAQRRHIISPQQRRTVESKIMYPSEP